MLTTVNREVDPWSKIKRATAPARKPIQLKCPWCAPPLNSSAPFCRRVFEWYDSREAGIGLLAFRGAGLLLEHSPPPVLCSRDVGNPRDWKQYGTAQFPFAASGLKGNTRIPITYYWQFFFFCCNINNDDNDTITLCFLYNSDKAFWFFFLPKTDTFLSW